jgi:lysozyme family protein
MNRFDKYHEVIAKREGGYSNNPNDKGKETYCGISRVFHPDWAGWDIIDANAPLKSNEVLKDAQLAQLVKDFYYNEYWLKSKADSFKENRVCLHLFDFSVNAGLSRAAKLLQKVVGAKEDGVIGPATIASVNGSISAGAKYVQARKDYYTKIGVGTNAEFLKGWLKRVDIVDKEV